MGQSVAVISAQQKSANSRATAVAATAVAPTGVAATDLAYFLAARSAKRLDRQLSGPPRSGRWSPGWARLGGLGWSALAQPWSGRC
jgi:hypothetical protein